MQKNDLLAIQKDMTCWIPTDDPNRKSMKIGSAVEREKKKILEEDAYRDRALSISKKIQTGMK